MARKVEFDCVIRACDLLPNSINIIEDFLGTFNGNAPHEFEELEVVVGGELVEYIPAQISGPPEHCYPEEGGFIDNPLVYCYAANGKNKIDIQKCLRPEVLSKLLDIAYEEAVGE